MKAIQTEKKRMNIESRAQSVIDGRLMDAFWAGVEHYGTTDLVVHFDATVDVDPITVCVREHLVQHPEVPRAMAARYARPAKLAAAILTRGSTAFWLTVSFPDGEGLTTTVIAQRLARGGAA